MKYYKQLLILSVVFFAFTALFSCSSNRDDNNSNNSNAETVDIMVATFISGTPFTVQGNDFFVNAKDKWEQKNIPFGKDTKTYTLQVRQPDPNTRTVMKLFIYKNGKEIFNRSGEARIDIELKNGVISSSSDVNTYP
ncbi:hypothetical protein M2T79_09270 [Elizabethkingia miricola]|uniref:hypothetical protein n=1 Tax=Elizabethkingia miricola TaxID=172045 RepID=UPI0020188CEF|nr:hypothetical protein [Elizabethkingia miricola]MCL1656788.1 hypothetical protein [Elizabethkingia miricola]